MDASAAVTKSASADPWRPYRPSDEMPWDLRRVVHLHRRAGFAATWKELQRDLREGPESAVDRLLSGSSRLDHQIDDFERVAQLIGDSAERSNQPQRLKAWWMYRMLLTPDPLAERLALMWHNHFATSNRKVNDLALMRRQNELFRALGRAPFGELLREVVRGPAVLIWLDAPANHKGRPNENLARELMELFTLGIGHYGEADVKEAARALTGWTVAHDQFAFQAALHDDGEKTVLNRRGRWTGDDLVAMLLDHPATSQRLVWRLCGELLGEGVVEPAGLESLAAALRHSGMNIGQAVATILKSELFFSERNIRRRIASPAEFVIGAVRCCQQLDPPPPTMELADWTARMGQDLFYPPSVGGWNGGRDWLRTGALIARSNFAAALASGRFSGDAKANWRKFAATCGCGEEPAEFVGLVGDLLFGGQPGAGWNDRVLRAVSEKPRERILQNIVSAALSSSEAQIQ